MNWFEKIIGWCETKNQEPLVNGGGTDAAHLTKMFDTDKLLALQLENLEKNNELIAEQLDHIKWAKCSLWGMFFLGLIAFIFQVFKEFNLFWIIGIDQ